jgi:hypothetical protein
MNGFPWTAEFFFWILGFLTLWKVIDQRRRINAKLQTKTEFEIESGTNTRLLAGALPASITLIALSLIAPSSTWIDSRNSLLSGLSLTLVLMVIAICVLCLLVLGFIVFLRVPKFLLRFLGFQDAM